MALTQCSGRGGRGPPQRARCRCRRKPSRPSRSRRPPPRPSGAAPRCDLMIPATGHPMIPATKRGVTWLPTDLHAHLPVPVAHSFRLLVQLECSVGRAAAGGGWVLRGWRREAGQGRVAAGAWPPRCATTTCCHVFITPECSQLTLAQGPLVCATAWRPPGQAAHSYPTPTKGGCAGERSKRGGGPDAAGVPAAVVQLGRAGRRARRPPSPC